MGKKIEGVCALCGNHKELSREHFPPKAAFNSGEYKHIRVNLFKSKLSIVWAEKWKQGGNAQHRTCIECNNNTGGWYANAYKELARACRIYGRPYNAGLVRSIRISSLYPLRVVKQAICTTLVSCNPDPNRMNDMVTVDPHGRVRHDLPHVDTKKAFAALPALRQFVLDRHAKGLPKGVRLYWYVAAGTSTRSTGFASYISRRTGNYAVFAEFSWPPLGWVLVFDGQIEEPLSEVTHWADYEYDQEWSSNAIAVSCHLALGNPLEFKTMYDLSPSEL